jgi:multiple sugar transport system permease protein
MTHALKNSWKYILLVVICVVFLFPLAWALVCSVKPEAEILSYPPKWVPDVFTWSNYTTVLARYPYLDWAKNSIITAGLGTLLILLFSSLAAYALGRFEFRGKKLIYSVIVAMLLIPIQAYMIPLYLMCAKMGILNTYASIILPSVANVTSIFILTSFLRACRRSWKKRRESTDAASSAFSRRSCSRFPNRHFPRSPFLPLSPTGTASCGR